MYKREINNNKELYKKICITSNFNTYLSSNLGMQINKPFQGIFIKSNKILLENMVEKLEIGENEYIMTGFSTASKTYGDTSYLKEVRDFKYFYEVENIKYTRKVGFLENKSILKFEYEIANHSKENVGFKIIPFVTYRDLFNMKKSNVLNFNTRDIEDGCLVNLSITDSCDLCIKSDNAKFRKRNEFLNNITHECVTNKISSNLFIEDVYIPCEYIVKLKPLKEVTFSIYISDKEIIEEDKKAKIVALRDISKFEIAQEYPELIKLSSAILNFDMNNVVSKIPFEIDINTFVKFENKNIINKCISELTTITRAIQGRYICLNRFDECQDSIKKIISYIDKIEKEKEYNSNLLLNLKLWLIIQIYELFIKYESIDDEIISFAKDTIDNFNLKKSYDEDVLNSLETICLMYNSYRIYENMFASTKYNNLYGSLEGLLRDRFWDSDKKILKDNLNNKECTVSLDMLYALSLPFSIASQDVFFKCLDTIFKELYTPYGLRKFPKSHKNYNGNIYPKYMAHFVAANLKQNGDSVTSKKIVYNLVKELLQDIDKEVLNSIKSVYNEKKDCIETEGLDLITIAELIRLYEMLV